MQESSSTDTSPIKAANTDEQAPKDQQPKDQASLTFGQMLASTLWAALGVQNKKNRERDFSRGKATHFILFGIGFTVLFVLGMYTLVSLVLS